MSDYIYTTTKEIIWESKNLPVDISEVQWVLKEDHDKLRAKLIEAYGYLKAGKAQFAAHTTNSFVDDWLAWADKTLKDDEA